ncbi:hypothetical protein EGR_07884 [Echinococcus granulosus]|uniref:Uncharacterized protein n=1 Tax=Echinococcus granulosus TaxID=6210 RepID=W6UV09_ECHGR|nr:hypothetical protein EGR_07884 [Echinococcus granulosus]EUB57274.1 hypothetical protein EGR_07884 [Echinococcus granulosus]
MYYRCREGQKDYWYGSEAMLPNGSKMTLSFSELHPLRSSWSISSVGQFDVVSTERIAFTKQPRQSSYLCITEKISDSNATDSSPPFQRIWSFILIESCIVGSWSLRVYVHPSA